MNVPAELAEREQWVAWRYEERGGKRTKVPCQPREPARRASSTDAATWGTLAAALHAAEGPGIAGVGFVFSAADPYCGVDLDKCIDSDGVLHPAVESIVARLDSYTELSPSGTGVHVILKATVNGGRKRTADTPWDAEIETYNQGRFFCMTGALLAGTTTTVNERQEQLDAIRAELLPEPERPKAREPASPSTLDDRELLERARAAKNGAGFDRLWAGDTSSHGGDASAADLALCGLLAFWTGPDPHRIDGLFRQSALMRDKWDARRGDSTYGQLTIDKAISGRSEFYASHARAHAARGGAERPAASATGDTANVYEITWSDHKPPRLVLPDVPALNDTAGLCAWLTCVFNLHAAHPITTGRHEGLRGPDGHAVLERRGAAPLRFEPQSKINTPARLIEVLSWQTGPTDGAIHALKGEHCRQIAHVVRMLCGATKAISDDEETAALILVFLAEAIVQEGFTLYGTTEQRYEAATALQRELDEHTGRPRGVARYLIDANTGEYVIRVQDLGESVRRQLGSGLTRGFLDGRMAGLGWTKAALAGFALPGRAGRKGPHARCNVYRGLLADTDDQGSVNT